MTPVTTPMNGTAVMALAAALALAGCSQQPSVESATMVLSDVLITSAQGAVLLSGFNAIGGSPTAHPATGLYAASIVGNVVTLRWNPPAGGLPPTHYVLEGGVVPGQVLGGIATGGPHPIFTFAAPSGAFYLRVHTMSGSQRATASNEIRIFVNTPTPPSPPANLVGLDDGGVLTLVWRNTFAGGAQTGTMVDITGAFVGSVPLGAVEGYSFNGVPDGSYTFRVRAVNASGSSLASNPVTLTFPGRCDTAVGTPTNFLAYREGSTVFTVWESPATGSAHQGYFLKVSGSLVDAILTSGTALSATAPPGSYTLSVFAVNACGSGIPTASQTVVVP